MTTGSRILADGNEDDLPREIPLPAAGQLLAEGGDSRTLECRPQGTLDLPVDRNCSSGPGGAGQIVEPVSQAERAKPLGCVSVWARPVRSWGEWRD